MMTISIPVPCSVAWPTITSANANAKSFLGYDAIILRADLPYLSYGKQFVKALRDEGVSLIAYTRAPVHVKSKDVSQATPYEYATLQLVKQYKAEVCFPDGKPMLHPKGYDTYVSPMLLDLVEYVRLTKELVWDTGLWDAVLCDGAVTNQLYCVNPYLADFDRDKKADVQQPFGWRRAAEVQRKGLWRWATLMTANQIPWIANGAWEPNHVELESRKYTCYPPEIEPSWLLELAPGMMVEKFGEFPYYDYTAPNPPVTGPAQSLMWDFYVRQIRYWQRAGRFVLMGGSYINQQFICATAASLGTAVVGQLPVIGQVQADLREKKSGLSPDAIMGNWGKYEWVRRYQKGSIQVNPASSTFRMIT